MLSEIDKLLVRNTAGTNEDHSISGIVGSDIVDEVLTLDALDVFLWSKDGSAKGLALISSGVQMIEYNFLQLLVDFLLLPENHISLAFNSRWFEFRVSEDIREDVDSLWNVGIERLCVVNSIFSLIGKRIRLEYNRIVVMSVVKTYRSICVEVATHVLNLQL